MNAPNFASLTISGCLALLLSVGLSCAFAEPTNQGLSSQELFRLGERIYREGILPSGEPVQSLVKGDVLVPGTSFTCVSCHLRAGLGSFEGGVFTPPTNGAKLFQPHRIYSSPKRDAMPLKPSQVVDQNLKYFLTPVSRPIYTDKTLADALRDGTDSAGRTMNDIMPRYLLDDKDMNILVSYLKSLSAEFSPGASETEIRFATIIADDVSPEEQNAMLAPLENFIKNKNSATFRDPRAIYASRSTGVRSSIMADITLMSLGIGLRKLSLARWELKGPPATWRSQLEEYYRKEPVFAILGGISNQEWQPIHQFCEENRIPNFFPITNFPLISQSDWYTLYLSKGYYQEGEGAARFLNGKDELKGKPLLQIVRDSREGRALSRGFQETWQELGNAEPMTLTIKAGEILTKEYLLQKTAGETPASIILWDGPASLDALKILAAAKNRPAMVLASSSYLGKSMFSLNEPVRNFTYLTYPYGITPLPEEKTQFSMGNRKFNAEANAVPTTRISQQAYILTLILDMALWDMKGNYYRDNLLDVTGMIMDQDVPLYERLSFGPGQRYASKGCYIVQLAKTGLVKKSSWVTH